jgi:hypothetical protein
VEPVLGLANPLPHVRHASVPEVSLYLPCGQSEQSLAETGSWPREHEGAFVMVMGVFTVESPVQ